MKIFLKSVFVFVLLLAGCTTANLIMQVDPTLEENASVYEVVFSDAWSDDKYNLSFGPYRVSDFDSSWTTTRNSPSQGSFWGDLLHELTGINTSDIPEPRDTEPPVTITGVTSIHDTKEYISQSLSYNFKRGDEVSWNSQCDFKAKKNISKSGDRITNVQTLSSNFICSYTKADDEPYNEQWTLEIEKYGYSELNISLVGHGEGKLFRAHSGAGTYEMSDGSSPKLLRPGDPGYTWTDDNIIVAAVSVRVKVPRVWLDKRNSDSMNDVLAMASTGLLIYNWKIAPTLER